MDFERGLVNLAHVLKRSGLSSDSEAYLDFTGLKRQLRESIVNERRYAVLGPQEQERRERILRELDRLAFRHTGQSFLELCDPAVRPHDNTAIRMGKRVETPDLWYMPGTEGTGEYVVVLRNELGRVGYRKLEGACRIRVEPEAVGRALIARLLTRSRGWKQPGDEGEDRYSIVVSPEQLADTLGIAIRALSPGEVRAQVNPSAPEWLQRTVARVIQTKPARQRRPGQREIFFSYSHKDKKWLDRFRIMLKPAIQSYMLWDDTKIAPGGKWKDEIRESLEAAKVAVLLVSKNFLASDFIQKHELPPLLEAEKEEGLTILWVPVGFSMYQDTEIAQYQAAHDPSRPLDSLKGASRDKALVEVCEKIKAAVEKIHPAAR